MENKNLMALVGGIAGVLVLGFLFLNVDRDEVVRDEVVVEEGVVMVDADEDSEEENMVELIGEGFEYVEFEQARFEELLGDRSVALFFHADWCPTCRNQDKLISENLSKFPSDAVVLKVNYDKEVDLRKEYGVKTQSAVVVLGKDGLEKARLSSFKKVDDLISKF